VTQESERFEQVEANVKLSIVPWVSASGDVTVEITPEFKTPVGTLSSNVPPTINTRVLDSTVRLKDGETIILGGLISENETSKVSKIPFLGDLPFIGKLFRTSSKSKVKTELMIYITPHVFYGDENEVEKWNSLRNDELDSTSKK
jgi:type IV pilus assembly protein PilQ